MEIREYYNNKKRYTREEKKRLEQKIKLEKEARQQKANGILLKLFFDVDEVKEKKNTGGSKK